MKCETALETSNYILMWFQSTPELTSYEASDGEGLDTFRRVAFIYVCMCVCVCKGHCRENPFAQGAGVSSPAGNRFIYLRPLRFGVG